MKEMCALYTLYPSMFTLLISPWSQSQFTGELQKAKFANDKIDIPSFEAIQIQFSFQLERLQTWAP